MKHIKDNSRDDHHYLLSVVLIDDEMTNAECLDDLEYQQMHISRYINYIVVIVSINIFDKTMFVPMIYLDIRMRENIVNRNNFTGVILVV